MLRMNREPLEPQVMPSVDTAGKVVVDVGCSDGGNLSLLQGDRYGIDVDVQAIARGLATYPELKLRIGRAERLPYPDGFCDVLVSHVSLTYSDLRKSLPEARRVMKPGAYLLLTMHSWGHQWRFCRAAIEDGAWKRIIDHCIYVFPVSLWYHFTGKVFGRPWRPDRIEFCQTEWQLRRQIEAAGFRITRMERTAQHWVIEGVAV